MSETDLLMVAVTTVVNAAVTWGVVKTQLAWLRADVDELKKLRDALVAHALKLSKMEE